MTTAARRWYGPMSDAGDPNKDRSRRQGTSEKGVRHTVIKNLPVKDWESDLVQRNFTSAT